MKKSTFVLSTLAAALFLFTGISSAAEEQVAYTDPTGVSVEFEPDGSDWKRISSIGEAELTFTDRKDIQNARRKAEMQAKAAISKFLSEKIKSEEVSEELTKTLSDSTLSKAGTDKTANRKTVDTLISKISNTSEAILKGVIVIEQNEDVTNKRVTVKVGVSRKTISVANSLKKSLSEDSTQAQPSGGNMATQTVDEPPPSNAIRRSKNADNY